MNNEWNYTQIHNIDNKSKQERRMNEEELTKRASKQDDPIFENNQMPFLNNQISQIPHLQSMNSANSINYDNNYSNDQNKEQMQVEELEVVRGKDKPTLNQAEIIRLFQEQMENEEKEKAMIQLKRLESMKNKQKNPKRASTISNTEEINVKTKQNLIPINHSQVEKSLRIKSKIEKIATEYKQLYRPSIYDNKLQKYRFECKEKLIYFVCFGLQELSQLNQEELTLAEKQILQKRTNQAELIAFCRSIVRDIDLELLKVLNKNYRSEINKEYKNQWDIMINNIKDETNFQLRRRIITRSFTAKQISKAPEIQFYTTAKREEILEKEKRYIAEFTVENNLNEYEREKEDFPERARVQSIDLKKDENLNASSYNAVKGIRNIKNINKYVEESSILLLEELLSDSHLLQMRKRLEEDLSGNSKATLLDNFKKVFGF